MPFYEYECPKCNHRDEVLQKIGDKPLTKCPSCGKKGLKKLISAPVFRLKGSGWYETDFKSDKENKRNLAGADKEEAKSEAKTEDKADAKSDAKPEAAKADAPKADAPKAEKSEKAEKSDKSEKSQSARPAPDKPAASKSASKSKAKSRLAKRPKRR